MNRSVLTSVLNLGDHVSFVAGLSVDWPTPRCSSQVKIGRQRLNC